MSAQPIVFVIPEEAPEPRRSRGPQQSWLQEVQPTDPVAGESRWRLKRSRVSVEEHLVPQFFSQPHSIRHYVESPGSEVSRVTGEIDALLAGREDEVTPTEYAYLRARSTVESTYGRIKAGQNVPEMVPVPSVTTDDVGGIRLAWQVGTKQVRANFGATLDLRSYLYYESGLEHNAEPLDPEHLAGRLAWLAGR